jgi:hypothetical protein
LANLRRGDGIPSRKKIVIVLDQFEQWLHANPAMENTELVRSLRQCDGGQVQCVVMVRDDFWMGVTRFFKEMETPLVETRNSAPVDLFDGRHARKVLGYFGQAAGALPSGFDERTKEQNDFLDQAVAGLAQEGKVNCVRLAVFAEMVKGKHWTPGTLKEVGGPTGVGVTFLEETFSAATAPPEHKHHQIAARKVLMTLLPESGTDIKGRKRSLIELQSVSGYATRPREFDDLIRILDSELRLITPTDPIGINSDDESSSQTEVSQRCYQLTHDYLVHSLRDWLTRKQKETRRGRAELTLAERSALWNAKPENRRLPSIGEWARIGLFTRSSVWTQAQRKMMGASAKFYFVRWLAAAVLMLVVGWGAWEYWSAMRARLLRDHLLGASVAEVPALLEEMRPHRRLIEPVLREALAAEQDPKKKLVLSLALLPSDRDQVEYLYERLLGASPQDFVVIRHALTPFKDSLTERLWTELADMRSDRDRRFHAACALVEYACGNPRCREAVAVVVEGVDQLITENPLVLSYWKDALEPARAELLRALVVLLEDIKWHSQDRRAIIEFYRALAADHPDRFDPMEARLARAERPDPQGTNQARQKATVAAALVALGKTDNVWPLLVHTPSPTLRSYLIERIATSGVHPRTILNRLNEEKDISARRALILALGSCPVDRVPEAAPLLIELYENDPDAGVHAAAGWAIRNWNLGARLQSVNEKLATNKIEGDRNWYINKQHQTYSVVSGPGRWFLRKDGIAQVVPAHRFAIACTEVTVRQFRERFPDHAYDQTVATDQNSPVNAVTWYQAAEYCNWLSKEECIPEDQWCYRPNENGMLEFVPDYQNRSGYRLPTEAEWEYACRAGAETLWCFGEADKDLVGCYAWWLGNAHADGSQRSFPVAMLKPNDYGLFDMHGNVAEWCQESEMQPGEMAPEEIESAGRGGYYFSDFPKVSCDRRFHYTRIASFKYVGFRPVRTMPPRETCK